MLALNCYLQFMFFFFNDTATTEIYTLSLHDALPISSSSTWSWCRAGRSRVSWAAPSASPSSAARWAPATGRHRSEEHTSELQSRLHLVCRLLLEKKKNTAQLSDYAHPYYPYTS